MVTQTATRRNPFRDMSFRKKIALLIFISIFLPSALMSMLTYQMAEHSILEQTALSVAGTMTTALSDVDASLNAALSISDRALGETLLVELAHHTDPLTNEEKNEYYPQAFELLNYYISRIKAPNILSSIDSYYLYLPYQHTVITTDSTYYENIWPQDLDFVTRMADNDYLNDWYATRPVNYSTLHGQGSDVTLLTYGQPIYSETGELLAICALNLRTSLFSRLYENVARGLPCSVVICSRDKNVICTDGAEDAALPSDELVNAAFSAEKNAGRSRLTTDAGERLILFETSAYTGWTAVASIDTSVVLAQVYQIRTFLFILLLIGVLLILLIAFYISWLFYHPLDKVVTAMKQIGLRNLDYRIEDDRQDEYRQVYDGFNSMAGELEALLSQVTTEKMLNTTAQIKLLQEQINPHFLYNTLDSIYSISRLHDVPEISQMVLALSRFFRISLSDGKDIVTLREAIALVDSYLTIQNIRFQGKFTFEVAAGQELLSLLVPKLILQPFVENSIYHGIERKKEGGSLTVSARLEQDALILLVSDSGAGIPEEKLHEIQQLLADPSLEPREKGGNFAIRNLHSQVRLRFGSAYGISIESREGEGTAVTIRLPAIANMEQLKEKSLLPLS